MARLNQQQKRYLAHHHIDLDETYDVSGLARGEWRARMKAEGKLFAYGGAPCLRGHALRTRHGNCIECLPAAIAFARRGALPGYVYLAQSRSTALLKIGFSADDPDNRLYIANLEGYAGVADWRIFMRLWSARAGALELSLHKGLAPWRIDRDWVRGGGAVVAREVFACSLEDAIAALIDEATFAEIQMICHY